MIEGIGKCLSHSVEGTINSKMVKIPWDKLDDGISEPNLYVKEIMDTVKEFLQPLRGTINNVYFIKILNKVCLVVNDLFTQGIFKSKRISDMGVLQLLCGTILN